MCSHLESPEYVELESQRSLGGNPDIIIVCHCSKSITIAKLIIPFETNISKIQEPKLINISCLTLLDSVIISGS